MEYQCNRILSSPEASWTEFAFVNIKSKLQLIRRRDMEVSLHIENVELDRLRAPL